MREIDELKHEIIRLRIKCGEIADPRFSDPEFYRTTPPLRDMQHGELFNERRMMALDSQDVDQIISFPFFFAPRSGAFREPEQS